MYWNIQKNKQIRIRLQFDYDSVTQDIQDVINAKEDSSITSALYNAIDTFKSR